jgi:serine/threonine protein kinase
MDLRTYLSKHRDNRLLNRILLQVVSGLKELHGLGFVHRDLKPENIVLNLGHPIKVAIIDFNRALPTSNTCNYGNRGTPGYQPTQISFLDGSIEWDIYALVAIVLECDMGPQYFNKAAEEYHGFQIFHKYLGQEVVCKHLKVLG